MTSDDHNVRTALLITGGCALGLGLGLYSLNANRRRDEELALLRRDIDRLAAQLDDITKSDSITRKRYDSLQVATGASTSRGPALSSASSIGDLFYDSLSSPYTGSVDEVGTAAIEDTEVDMGHTNLLLKEADMQAESSEEKVKLDIYNKLKKVHDAEKNNCEFMWRFARAAYNIANLYAGIDEKKRERYIMEAKKYALEAYDLANDNGEANKWSAITIGVACDYASTKEKIALGNAFKMHIDKALQLLTPESTLFHLRARWCYNVAELTWMERKIAQTLFGDPPKSTYEEALESFLEAEKLKPNQWPENLLWLGKTYIALKQNAKALPYLQTASKLPVNEPEEQVVHDEVMKLLAKIGK